MITTFDNKQWDKEELLANMYDDSFYYGYLGKNALSSSSFKTILKSPKTYYYTQKYGDNNSSQALRDGKLFHTMILEPHKLDDLIIIDCKTKASKEYKLALENNSEVYTTSEIKSAERLSDAILKNEGALELISKSQFEVPEIIMIEDIPVRAKVDILKKNMIVDLKTTTEINQFRYSADKYCYDLQAYLYCRIFNIENFVFLCIDKGSLDIGIFECSEEFIEKGKVKFEQALSNYNYFFKNKEIDINQYVLRGIL